MVRNKKDVAVTGIGMICPLGVSLDECWNNMLMGRSGIRRIQEFDTARCLTKIAGELPAEYSELEHRFGLDEVSGKLPPPVKLSSITARQAIEHSGLELEKANTMNVAVISGCAGSTYGDILSPAEKNNLKTLYSMEMLNAPALFVSNEYGFQGPSFNVATACSSGAYALGLGYDYVCRTKGIAVAIGVDLMVHKDVIDGFNRLMALSEQNDYPEKASCPFDRKRSGFVLANGACTVILEDYDYAVRRGAVIYAVMSGYAFTSEAYNIIAPVADGSGMAETMAMALKNAGVAKEKIKYINAHGTSTPHNDLAETRAIRKVFAQQAYKIPVSSQKSMLGHSIGAAGVIEFAVTALSLHHQIITPTINYEDCDPECDLDYVPNYSRPVEDMEAAVTNSFGFGGHNASIVLERRHI